MRLLIYAAAGSLAAVPSVAGELLVSIEIPRLSVAEYHRPYVAAWLERADQRVTNLAVWYEVEKRGGEGTKWLKDMRQWWRKSGRELTMPIDGLSGATRPPGRHQLAFSTDKAPLAGLEEGEYNLVIEAAREVGGHELIRLPFRWPAKAPLNGTAKGETELGTVALQYTP